WSVAPQLVSKPVGGHRAVHLDEQHREQQALERASDEHGTAVAADTQRAEDPVPRCPTHVVSIAPERRSPGEGRPPVSRARHGHDTPAPYGPTRRPTRR